jgi:hypothetical protein
LFPSFPSVSRGDRQHTRAIRQTDRHCGEVIGASIEVHPISGPGLLQLGYLNLLKVPLELLFNVHEFKLVDGISTIVPSGANNP